MAASPVSSKQQPVGLKLDVSTAIEIGGTYIRKMAGVDFLVKLLGYIVRFKILSLSANPTANAVPLDFHKKLLGSIVESRMLSNAGKSPSTFLSATKLAETPEDFANKDNNTKVPASCECPWLPSVASLSSASPIKLISYLALLCRTLEQISSDGGYLARYMFTSWNRDQLTLEYKRWKSVSLTCLLIVEISYLVRFVQQRMEKRRHGGNPLVASPSSPVSGDGEPFPAGRSESPDKQQQQQHQSPLHTRSASHVQFEKAKGVEEYHRVAVPSHSSPKYKYRFQHLAAGTPITNGDASNSLIVAIRCACDMYIYYRWLPSWNPPDFWQFSAGVVSAVLGIYLVMEETIGDVKKNQQQSQKSKGSNAPAVPVSGGQIVAKAITDGDRRNGADDGNGCAEISPKANGAVPISPAA